MVARLIGTYFRDPRSFLRELIRDYSEQYIESVRGLQDLSTLEFTSRTSEVYLELLRGIQSVRESKQQCSVGWQNLFWNLTPDTMFSVLIFPNPRTPTQTILREKIKAQKKRTSKFLKAISDVLHSRDSFENPQSVEEEKQRCF